MINVRHFVRTIDITITAFVVIILVLFMSPYVKTYATSGTWVRSTNGTYTFTVPSDVNSIEVQAWGAGGGGGGSTSYDAGTGDGGGGGGYSMRIINVTPLSTHTVVVGQGGVGATGVASGIMYSGLNGGSTTFDSTSVVANGGAGGRSDDCGGDGGCDYTSSPGGAIGSGFYAYSGGTGAYPFGCSISGAEYGGAGGSSAGTNSNGTNATNDTCTNYFSGAIAPSGGGNGGSPGDASSSYAGYNGFSPGGGGGGASFKSPTHANGGNGADGQVIITYNIMSSSTSALINVSINPIITISDTSGGSLIMPTITPNVSAGRMSWISDTISVNTNDTSGYTTTLQMTGTSNSLGALAATTNGTTAAPAVFSLGIGSSAPTGAWGFCLVGGSAFGTCDSGTGSSVAITAHKYAPVPKSTDTPFTIASISTNGSGTSIITFGAAVNVGQASGTYSGSVVYTATTN